MNKFLMPFAKPLVYFLLIVTVICSAAVYADESPSVAVTTAVVKQQAVAKVMLSYGVLEPDPDQVLSLSLPHAGLINRIWVRLGQRVKTGDKLLEIITAPEARMQFLQARSAVDFAQRELERKQQLLKEQLSTRAEVDMAKKNVRDTQATLEALRKRGMGDEQETLLASMDGIITRLDVTQGERVQADTTAVLIASEQRLIARLGVEPEDLSLLQPGTAVSITSVFGPSVKVDTTVREVHAMINPASHLVDVLAAIPSQQVGDMVLGSRILGHIQLPAHQALVVPRSAVLGIAPDTYLYKVVAGKAVQVAVKTGIETDDLIEVTGALHLTDRVVVSGNYELSDGMAVRETSVREGR
jgi:RND family efflux transporter MFP subunit